MGTPQKKYHITDEGKIYRIADNGEITEMGDISEVDREKKCPASRVTRKSRSPKPKTATRRPRPKREKTEDGNNYGCLVLILLVVGILAFFALN